MSIGKFFEDLGHDLKVAALDIDHAFVKIFVTLFGLQEWEAFAQAAEALFKTAFGKVVMDAASKLIAGMEAGTPVATIIEQLVALIISEGASAGITIAEEIATFLANLVLAAIKGNLSTTSSTANNAPAA